MKTSDQPFETNGHALTGKASLDFVNREDFNTFALRITGYNPDRFDPVALKVFASLNNWIITLYALDKNRQQQEGAPVEKLPVKKFKMEMDSPTFLSCIRSFDLVVTNRAFDIDDIEVINR
jgi:hypothetical protein